ALLGGPFQGDFPGMGPEEVPADGLAQVPGRLECHGPLDGHEDVQSRLTRGLDYGVQRHLPQESPQPECNTAADCEAARVELGLGSLGLLPRVDVGIDVEYQVVGVVEDRLLEGFQ